MLRQLRKAMANEKTEWMFEGVIEVDETYAGGKPRKSNAVRNNEGNDIAKQKVKNKRGKGTKKLAVNGLDKEPLNKKYTHLTVNHSKGQYFAGSYNGIDISTNGIENFWGILKRGIIGVYHHISGEYLQTYLDEFCFRQNTRLDTNMFNVLLEQCVLV
ncbi:hypothetical protein AGMMS49579_08800 [Spirochaetia bacterium]|nr:hypothetical protein AGMMS49579_08800 [Spirochaetia bacterium]